MVAMKQFTSTATKDGRWWAVQCDQEPGALSQVARLDQAVEHQREAISMITGLPEDEIDVVINPQLDEVLTHGLAIAHLRREEADRLQREASELTSAIAHTMVEEGLSLRDAGFILGISHQRVAQLVSAKAPARKAKEIVATYEAVSAATLRAALDAANASFVPLDTAATHLVTMFLDESTTRGEEVFLMAKGDIDTVYEDGQWKNKVEGGQRATSTHATKAEAEKAGRDMARAREVEHVIKKKDGTIGEKNSYGNDPRSSKG